jgi:hypothetical protein
LTSVSARIASILINGVLLSGIKNTSFMSYPGSNFDSVLYLRDSLI